MTHDTHENEIDQWLGGWTCGATRERRQEIADLRLSQSESVMLDAHAQHCYACRRILVQAMTGEEPPVPASMDRIEALLRDLRPLDAFARQEKVAFVGDLGDLGSRARDWVASTWKRLAEPVADLTFAWAAEVPQAVRGPSRGEAARPGRRPPLRARVWDPKRGAAPPEAIELEVVQSFRIDDEHRFCGELRTPELDYRGWYVALTLDVPGHDERVGVAASLERSRGRLVAAFRARVPESWASDLKIAEDKLQAHLIRP